MGRFSRLALHAGLILQAWALPFTAGRSPQAVPDKYIVTLRPGVSISDVKTHLNWVTNVHKRSVSRRDTTGVEQVYSIEDFNGYAGSFDAATIEEIRHSDQVISVEQDMIWTLLDGPSDPDRFSTQKDAPWGLGSISHRKPNWTEYIHNPSGGQGTYAYIIDTGLLTTHSEFDGGRAQLGFNAYPDTDFVDSVGHGTHVAGTIAGKTYGVAKKATVVSVKVFGTSSSTTAIVLAGYNWAVNNITAENRQDVSVISMSLGGPKSSTFNAAVASAFKAGVLTVVAAGNDGQEAIWVSPASAPEAITVGAVDVENIKPWWSNYGDLVDIFAPGVEVLSAWIGSDDDKEWLDGTSMATPHVSGLVLYLKSLEAGTYAKAAVVADKIKELATADVVTDGGDGSPNLLAYNGNGA